MAANDKMSKISEAGGGGQGVAILCHEVALHVRIAASLFKKDLAVKMLLTK